MGYKIRVSARAIVVHEENLLLNCFGGGLYYNFPGGGIEETETALEAVVREVFEESGLAVAVERHLFTFEYEPSHCNDANGNFHHISVFFQCKLIGGPQITPPTHPDTNPLDPSMTSAAKWVPISELHATPFVPEMIYDSLVRYFETGIFEPSFFEA
ncbi:MAG: NUDIX domain-containing protein [Oscillospiraceae bacterium]|jgi:8-oxo-dGTP diphosphatase|nr:NUDIX domain-containing protein [Oscillospiraceae bacterium]